MAPRDRNDPTHSASSDGTYTRADLEHDFPTDTVCLDWLWRENCSPDGEHAHCPKCETTRRFHRVKSRPSYSCDTCGQHIHPTAGTIFHKSSTGLDLWFKAIFIMGSTRCGASAKQIEREIGVTYKTAWRMAKLIRSHLMDQDADPDPLDGEVEMDETWVGGKPRVGEFRGLSGSALRVARGKRVHEKKTTVFGAVERGGRVRANVVADRTYETLSMHAKWYVLPSSTVFTDEWAAYETIGKGYRAHHRINHSEKVYVHGNVHTQTIEGFWALLKGGIGGTYHSVSRKYLQTYLNEFAWRYNHRDDVQPMFLTLLGRAALPAA
jgi:transposase